MTHDRHELRNNAKFSITLHYFLNKHWLLNGYVSIIQGNEAKDC